MKQNQVIALLMAISVLTVVFGASVIIENLLSIQLFSLIFSGYATVSLNTAVCFILSGFAFMLLIRSTHTIVREMVFKVLCFSLIAIASISFIQELHSIDLIERFMMADDFGVNDSRMATISALCFILLGSAFLALNSISFKSAGQYLLHIITLGSFISLMGYLYNIPSLYQISSDIAMATQSALAFFVVSIAATQLHPHLGITGVLRGNKIGSITARRILPFVLLLGALRIFGIHIDFISENFGAALFTTSFIFGGLLIIFLTSSKLNRIDEKRTEAENKVNDINQGLEKMIEMRTSQLVSSNNALLDEISERKRTEVALREVSDRFSKVFHSSPSGKAITVCEYQTDHEAWHDQIMRHRVVDINKAFLQILGYGRDEVILDHAINLEIIVDTDQRKEISHLLKTHGYFKNKEAALVRKDGSTQQCILSVEPIDIEGESHFLWVCYDNSERKKMEEQLHKAKESAEQLAQMKEQFLANMSHEIRTPMNSVIGFSNLLNQTELNSTQKEYVTTINTASKSLLHLINEILDYSKLEAGKSPIEKKEFALRDTLQNIYRMFMERAREKKLRLSITFDKQLPTRILGDETKLNQILMNLVSNAFKFTPAGTIYIDCKLVEESSHGLKIKFMVRDTGIGITAENIGSVFERFNQASADTTREYGGTGLGLSIVKQLVDMQNGDIGVESTPGEGTEFYFTLYYEKLAPMQPLLLPVKQAARKPKVNARSRVLLAEDNVMNQKLAMALLKNAGCEIDIAENGMEALDMLKYTNYDIVFMDIQMPVLDGYRTAQMIREKLKSDVPIVAVTAHAFKGEREKCLSYGMNDYLTKPYDEEDLLIIMLKYLPEKRALFSCDCALGTEEACACGNIDSYTKEPQKDVELAPTVTNLSYLNEISKGNKNFVAEMIEEFLSQNTEHLNRLEYALAKKQFDVIGKTVHTMKTTTSFVGLHTVIGDNLLAMEALAQTQQDFESLRRHFRIVQTQCMLAHEELRAVQVPV